MTTHEILLSGNHPDSFVTIETEDDISDNELLELAIEEMVKKTYIWSKTSEKLP